MLEIGTSGSVGGEGGNILAYPAGPAAEAPPQRPTVGPAFQTNAPRDGPQASSALLTLKIPADRANFLRLPFLSVPVCWHCERP